MSQCDDDPVDSFKIVVAEILRKAPSARHSTIFHIIYLYIYHYYRGPLTGFRVTLNLDTSNILNAAFDSYVLLSTRPLVSVEYLHCDHN